MGRAAMVSARLKLHRQLIDVAPAPVLARLERGDDWVARGVEVLGGMPVLGIIAAADVAAGPAQAQVHPGVAGLQAFLAPIGVAAVGLDLRKVRAVFWAHGFLSWTQWRAPA